MIPRRRDLPISDTPMNMAHNGLPFRRELLRKGVHLLSAVIPISYSIGLPRAILLPVLALISAIVLAVELGRTRSDTVQVWFQSIVGSLLREHERNQLSGATWLFLSLFGLGLLAPRGIAIAGMWAISVGDAAAAVIGRALRRGAPEYTAKTPAGSAACFLVTLVGALLIAHLTVPESIVGAAAATVAEWPSMRLDDNLRVGVAVGVGIFLWRITFS